MDLRVVSAFIAPSGANQQFDGFSESPQNGSDFPDPAPGHFNSVSQHLN
jgi:hypothetical protein